MKKRKKKMGWEYFAMIFVGSLIAGFFQYF